MLSLTTLALALATQVLAEGDLVEAEPISAPVHRANVGKVVFLSQAVALEKLTPASSSSASRSASAATWTCGSSCRAR
jgi:hypothetical protein